MYILKNIMIKLKTIQMWAIQDKNTFKNNPFLSPHSSLNKTEESAWKKFTENFKPKEILIEEGYNAIPLTLSIYKTGFYEDDTIPSPKSKTVAKYNNFCLKNKETKKLLLETISSTHTNLWKNFKIPKNSKKDSYQIVTVGIRLAY